MRQSKEITDQKRYIVIACAVFAREVHSCASSSKNIIDTILLDQGLHDIVEVGMVTELQKTIDEVDIDKYDAILLGYGLCNNGIRGLHAPIAMVIPKAHDCITLLMGSKEKYREYFDANPGTYYKSTGWVEQVTHHLSNPDSTTTKMGMQQYDEYVKLYGEDNAKYLMETLGEGGLKHYTKLTYIDTGVGDFPEYKEAMKGDAAERGWEYEEYQGNMDLLVKMFDGDWNDEDFIVLQPGKKVKPTYGDDIIGCE
jgi:hypothetical protein